VSKDKFVESVMGRLSSEYVLSLRLLEPHRAAIEAAYDSEGSATEDELDLLFSGLPDAKGRAVQAKYPLLNAVSLAVVETLDEDEDEDDDDDDDDEDEDEDEDDEDSDDDDEDEDDES
jgi:hypothetical protein